MAENNENNPYGTTSHVSSANPSSSFITKTSTANITDTIKHQRTATNGSGTQLTDNTKQTTIAISGDELADLILRPVSQMSLNGNLSLSSSTVSSSTSSISGGGGVSLNSLLLQAKQVESRHEVIALVHTHHNPSSGNHFLQRSSNTSSSSSNWQLLLNYHNWNHYRKHINDDDPTMVISFLGDTEVGKSHTIRELMSPDEERPYVQRGTDQVSSTTANVNLYPCTSLVPGVTVNMLDYEGEYGSEATVFQNNSHTTGGTVQTVGKKLTTNAVVSSLLNTNNLSSTSNNTNNSSLLKAMSNLGIASSNVSSSGSSASSSSSSSSSLGLRAEAVREYFPRLAYTTSDVVVVVGTEPFFSTRYLARVIEFAKRANAGVTDVDLPVLLLVSNKRDGDRCVLDIQASTEQFMQACGDSFRMLDQFFSALVCVYLPNKRNRTVDEMGNVHDGAEMFSMQINKLKRLLSALMRTRLLSRYEGGNHGSSSAGNKNGAATSSSQSRLITSKQGLWYELVPRMIRELNANRPVYVTRLVDEAWSAAMSGIAGDREAANDIMKAFVSYTRPPPALSLTVPNTDKDILQRFQLFYNLCCDLAVRITCARLRAVDATWRIDIRVRNFARTQLEAMLSLLEDVTPCGAVYGGRSTKAGENFGTPIERCDEPILCLQERRVHSKGHRSSRRVRGGGRTLWEKLASLLPYNPTWEGNFTEPSQLDGSIQKSSITSLIDRVLVLVAYNNQEFLKQLFLIQQAYSSTGIVRIEFAPLPGVTNIPSVCSPYLTNSLTSSSSSPTFSTCMPYCIGCTDKILQVPKNNENGNNTDSNKSNASAPTNNKSSNSWMMNKVMEVMDIIGLQPTSSSTSGNLSTSATPTNTVTGFNSTITPPMEGIAVGAQQVVTLGLCQECINHLPSIL